MLVGNKISGILFSHYTLVKKCFFPLWDLDSLIKSVSYDYSLI